MSSSQSILIYDDACQFCKRQIDLLIAFDPKQKMQLVAFSSKAARDLERQFPVLLEHDFNQGLRLIHSSGKISYGADAVYETICELKLFPYLSWMYKVPLLHQVFRQGYNLVARYRKLF
jgi:predicted DCC family thiol-disulfide oxidoreductase YuxK